MAQQMIHVKDKEVRRVLRGPADPGQAFMEVQGKMQELGRALRQVSYRMQLNEREQRKCKITIQELGALPQTTPMYRSAGAPPSFYSSPASSLTLNRTDVWPPIAPIVLTLQIHLHLRAGRDEGVREPHPQAEF